MYLFMCVCSCVYVPQYTHTHTAPGAEIARVHHHTHFCYCLIWVLVVKLRPSWVQGKHFVTSCTALRLCTDKGIEAQGDYVARAMSPTVSCV